MTAGQTLVAWSLCAATVLAIIVRPRQIHEAIWAGLGAVALVALGLVSVRGAAEAIMSGRNVYLFLIGMMLLAEVARRERIFDWFAARALHHANRSRSKLFNLLFAVGIIVTALLSNDATAIVLTPAVYTVIALIDVSPWPYVYACAFVANAASFILPISNPSNLLVYTRGLPSVKFWLISFTLPSIVSILLTFLALRLAFRADLRGIVANYSIPEPDPNPWIIVTLICGAGALLIVTAYNGPIGIATAVLGLFAVVVATQGTLSRAYEISKNISWSIVPLVAGLFVIVRGLDKAGGLLLMQRCLAEASALPLWQSNLVITWVTAVASAIFNNLPVALAAGEVLEAHGFAHAVPGAVLLGVNLGPNLFASGSLATLLWLVILRRNGLYVSAGDFFRLGLVVTPAALTAAALTVR